MDFFVAYTPGAHINPAVTVGQAVMGVFPWSKVLLFVSGQYIGSILATIVLYFVYYDAILAFNPSQHPSLNAASIFATFPGPGLTIRGALFDQTVGTAMLLFAVSAICNTKGFRVPEHFQALFICFVITGLCMTFGLNCGAIFNPARDITPRLTFAILTGNWDVFEYVYFSFTLNGRIGS